MKRQRAAIVLTPALIFFGSATFADISDSCRKLLGGERLTIAVPNSAGGGYDTYARALAPVLEKHGDLTARVANMPAGGGLAARSFVMNSDADALNVLIENVGDTVTAPMGSVGRGAQANKSFMIDGYEVVGIIHSEPSAWIGRAGLDVSAPDLGPLVASEGALDEALLPFFVAGRALGLTIDVVTGYEGTSEMTAAILRGEADISAMSLTTSLRRAQDEGINVVLVFSDGPYPDAPDLPYFSGEGSITWQLSSDLPEEEATFRRSLAAAVTQLRGSARGMFVSSNMSGDRQSCIAELMDVAILDPEFIEAADAQGRPVRPQSAAESEAYVASLIEAHVLLLPTLEEVAAEVMGR